MPDPELVSESPFESRPISGRDFVVTDSALGGTKLSVFQGRINFRPGVATRDLRFFYAPYLAFLRSEGLPEVTAFIDDTDSGNVVIFLQLKVDRSDIPEIVRSFLLREGLVDATIRAGQIQPLALERLAIETVDFEPRVVFFDKIKPVFNVSVIPLRGVVASRAEAERLLSDLNGGRLALSATFAFQGAAFEQNTIEIESESLLTSFAQKGLDGDGGEQKVTRKQIADVAREALRRIAITQNTEFADDTQASLTQHLVEALNAEVVQLSSNLEEASRALLDLGFDPADFRADLITRSRTRLSSKDHETFADYLRSVANNDDSSFGLDLDASDTGVSLGINAEGHEAFRDSIHSTYRDAFSERGVDVEFEGTKVVPKRVTLVRFDKERIRAAGKIRLESSRFTAKDSSGSLLMSLPESVLNASASTTIEERLHAAEAAGPPVGAVEAFAGPADRVPDGWMLCHGTPVSSVTFPELSRAIGKTWGTGDGTVDDFGNMRDFNLPDLRGRFLRSVDAGAGLDPGDRRAVGTGLAIDVGSVQDDAFASHIHGVSDPGHTHPAESRDSAQGSGGHTPRSGDGGGTPPGSYNVGSAVTGISLQSAGGNETRPRNAAVHFIIRVGRKLG